MYCSVVGLYGVAQQTRAVAKLMTFVAKLTIFVAKLITFVQHFCLLLLRDLLIPTESASYPNYKTEQGPKLGNFKKP